MDVPNAERILRKAFVLTAKENSREPGARLNQSRIASMTGISRLEVRNLLKLVPASANYPETRVEQLISAWKSDSKYLDSRGKPRQLPLRGKNASFENLAKHYGRDVTPRALRSELVRRGVASIHAGRIQLSKANQEATARFTSAIGDLKFLTSYMTGFDFRNLSRTYEIRRRSLTTTSQKDSNVIRRIAIDRFQTVINSIEELSAEKSRVLRKNSSSGRRILVTAIVASENED